LNVTEYRNYPVIKLTKRMMLNERLSNTLTVIHISFAAKWQRTEEYLLSEKEV
jgi:hypothetical protein